MTPPERDELEKQWRVNHDEHCRNEWPHDGTCYWPRPAVLDEGAGAQMGSA